jgi:hypothetical protein
VSYVNIADARGYKYATVDIDLLNPDQVNPRIPQQESGLDAILALVQEDHEGLLAMAKDVVEMNGFNPAELLSVSPAGSGRFVVKEGNRRVAARRLLRNPEQLKGHVTQQMLTRWRELASQDAAKSLPTSVFVVIGDDHEAWVDRRHLGPQGGLGLVPWDTKMKARRDSLRYGVADRAALLLDGLKKQDVETFKHLEPPKRTYTTFQRLLDSQSARSHIGIEQNEKGELVLMKGKRSLRLVEQVLKDLRATGSDKLTSRTIHNSADIKSYLVALDTRVGKVAESQPIVLNAESTTGKPPKTTKAKGRSADVMKSFIRPSATRPGKLFDELVKARKHEMPNAAIVLTRILLELSIDEFATVNNLSVGSDVDATVQSEVAAFREAVGRAGVATPKAINQALNRAASSAPNLDKKLETVIDALVVAGRMKSKEATAKKRELRERETVALLHDAVHRLDTVPSPTRVTHILEIVRPVLNAMETPTP